MSRLDGNAMSRREFTRAAVAIGGATALSACLGDDETIDAPTGTDPGTLPTRQHAWNDALETDSDGNVRPPEHHVLLGLSLVETPDEAVRERVESAFRGTERALEWSHEGLLFTIGYTPAYFDRFEGSLSDSVALPHPEPLTALESSESVSLDEDDALLHLASDDPALVLAGEEALFGNRDELNGHEITATIDDVFERTRRRTGFVGPGLPAEHHRDGEIGGLPSTEIPEEAPFFMGFRSGFRTSQATEDRVTIPDGPFEGGTTAHVESLRLQLRTWFDQDNHYQRVAKLFSPEHAENELVGEYGEALGTDSGLTDERIAATDADARSGLVGHAQKAARAREDGEPLLLRRDINTTDGDYPGLHFLSLQRSIDDFVRVREAMAGEDLDGVGARLNNGILQYIEVYRRGNFLVPPREHRALPEVIPE